MPELNNRQLTVINLLTTLGKPCGLLTILSASRGFFDSKHQLRDVLRQLNNLGKVKEQANGQFKVVIKPEPVANTVSPTKAVIPHLMVSEKPPFLQSTIPDKVALVDPVAPASIANNKTLNQGCVFPKHLANAFACLEKKPVIHDVLLKIAFLQRLRGNHSIEIGDMLNRIAQDLINTTGYTSEDIKKL
jgi:hypothetical protein